MKSLSLFDRGVARFIRALTRASTGYDIGELANELIRTHGPWKVWEHLGACAKINKALAQRYGEYNGQLVLALAGVLDGCRYCSIGHLYSANVALFRDKGVLGPIDEQGMLDYLRMTDPQILEYMTDLLADEEYAESRELLSRMWRLHQQEAEVRDDDDRLLRAALDVWTWAHECSIILGVEAKPGGVAPLGLMRPSASLLERYEQARKESRDAPRS